MAQPRLGAAIGVGGPVRGLQIPLQGCDQRVEAGVEHRTVIHVHDPVTAAPVIAGAQAPIVGPLQGNQGPVAVAQGVSCGDQRPDRHGQAPDPLQGLPHQILLPPGLGPIAPVLQAAAATAVGQDAGWPAPFRARLQHRLQLGQPVAPGGVTQAHPHRLLGQPPRHEADLAAEAPHPVPLVIQAA